MAVEPCGPGRPSSLLRTPSQQKWPTTLDIPHPPAPLDLLRTTPLPPTAIHAGLSSSTSASVSASATAPVRRRPTLSRRLPNKKEYIHPYLSGNFAPVATECPLTDCFYEGHIPKELAGCQYVRNGGNPFANSQPYRDAHWFDADGMLAGVLFRRNKDGTIQPSFLNKFILTDLLLSTPEYARLPYLPSIATLVNPHISTFWILLQIIRSFILAILTWLPGLGMQSKEKLRRISVANTSVYWHDGKALAGCESGPPMRIMLPGLDTVEWFTGEEEDEQGKAVTSKGFGAGPPLISMLREFTTAHPKVDPQTKELLLYHMCFEPPYLRISVIASTSQKDTKPPMVSTTARKLKGVPVRGLKQPKMMHDFGATLTKTIILDLPLSLDMMNLIKSKPILHYDPSKPSRFGVLPRYEPDRVRWFESPEACCVYHTANSWDDADRLAVNMLGCRLNSASLVYTAGNLIPPSHVLPPPDCPEKCQLYYWRFDLTDSARNVISHEFALSDVPLEFPSINEQYGLQEARYVYGTSMRDGSFNAGLGKAAKIDALVKMDALALIQKGKSLYSQGKLVRGESVDARTVEAILEAQRQGKADPADPIKIFEMPRGWYAQEMTFVPRCVPGQRVEDDGWLLFYAFDEGTGVHPSSGHVLPGATSELWILEAKQMKEVICQIKLPQRVPYGLHGTLFTEDQIAAQKPVDASKIRSWSSSVNNLDPFSRMLSGSPSMGTMGKASTDAPCSTHNHIYDAFLRDPIKVGAWWIKRNIEHWIA